MCRRKPFIATSAELSNRKAKLPRESSGPSTTKSRMSLSSSPVDTTCTYVICDMSLEYADPVRWQGENLELLGLHPTTLVAGLSFKRIGTFLHAVPMDMMSAVPHGRTARDGQQQQRREEGRGQAGHDLPRRRQHRRHARPERPGQHCRPAHPG